MDGQELEKLKQLTEKKFVNKRDYVSFFLPFNTRIE